MTPEERRSPEILNASRKRWIARGSGAQVQNVNLWINHYREMRKMMKILGKNGGRGFSGILRFLR
jgi:signal recognition particle subunit SRP54